MQKRLIRPSTSKLIRSDKNMKNNIFKQMINNSIFIRHCFYGIIEFKLVKIRLGQVGFIKQTVPKYNLTDR